MNPIQAMFGLSGGAAISNASVSASGAGNQTAAYNLNTSGSITGTGLATGTWLISGANSDYDARWTFLSGTLGGGSSPAGTWQNLGTTFVVSLLESVVGSVSEQVTVDIRRHSNGVIVTSATITLTATRTS